MLYNFWNNGILFVLGIKIKLNCFHFRRPLVIPRLRVGEGEFCMMNSATFIHQPLLFVTFTLHN